MSTVSLRHGLAYRFTLTETLSDGSMVSFLGCLAGNHPMTGPWCNPPRGSKGFAVVSWNKQRQDIILSIIGKEKLDKLQVNTFNVVDPVL